MGTPIQQLLKRFATALLLSSFCLGASGCATEARIGDPLTTLRDDTLGPTYHETAMRVLDAEPSNEKYLAALNRIVWYPGYTIEIREAAIQRLMEHDLDGLKRTIRLQLPRMSAWQGLTFLCELIAQENWTDLTPALVSSWGRPAGVFSRENERPEHQALAKMYGEDRVIDVVFDLFRTANSVAEQGLRTRCWELLHRLGQRDRLIALLAEADAAEDDLLLVDLRAAASELGIVPTNREEILWVRKLREPERAAFWREAVAALRAMPEDRRTRCELRDLAVAVSALRHEPDMLTAPEAELYARVDSYTREQKHHSHESNYDNYTGGGRDRLYDFRDELTWGDSAAMLLAVRALQVPQVVDHLFGYADRDQLDTSTEYGGVISLDELGRFEVREFPPNRREQDQRFNAPQVMIEAGYTALFHFHFHAQQPNNTAYAGPGFGDVNYADNTRANCLVLTFVDRGRMNVDFYRHGQVLIDLGEIHRTHR